jgi:integrase
MGVLIWVAMVTGARRGELCGLRWPHIRLPVGYLLITRSVVQRGGQRREKDTKTHQARRVALDERTVVILTEHRARCEARERRLAG